MKRPIKISESDLHPHIKARMQQRGVSLSEIETVLNNGRDADDTKEGTFGKVLVFPYNSYWDGEFFEEKEVTVYYKIKSDKLILLTTKARYGKDFVRSKL